MRCYRWAFGLLGGWLICGVVLALVLACAVLADASLMVALSQTRW